MAAKPNPRVYMDISIGDTPAGRITIELFADTNPRTAHIFRSVCTGNNPGNLHYKGNNFWLVSDTVLKGGDYGSQQDREAVFGIDPKRKNFVHKHDGFGVVSMVSPSSSQFAIALTALPDYDDNVYNSAQVVVGKVVEGLYVVRAIANSRSFRPVITDCGEIPVQLGPSISTSQNMPPNEFKQVISTSKERLSNCLKEIMNVNKQLIAVDTKDVKTPESEQELVKVAIDLEHSCNVLLDVKAEVGSLQKRQKELLSKTEIKISKVKNKRLFTEMIPILSYEELESFENLIKKHKSDYE